MHECPKCKERFAESGYCPHDGSILVAPGESPSPNDGGEAGHGSDNLATHGAASTGPLTGSAVEQVLKNVVETRNAERLIGVELDGRYKIEKQIGEGGMGVVFLARHMVIEKAVAIKVLRAEVATDEAVVKRFVQEARAASRIGHPNIIDVTDFGTTKDGLTYQVMEYLEGQTLANLLLKEGRLTLGRALTIMAQMARALGAAHEKGIVHRDLKPENVFLMNREGRSDFVKIVDFGIAKVQPPDGGAVGPRLTRLGTVFGTPEYMSPEQASGRNDVDLRADIYALGIILYEMLCGRVPLRGETTVRTLAMQMLDDPRPMREVQAEVEITVDQEAVIMRSLAKKRDQRYSSMSEFLNALQEVTSHTELDLPLVVQQERLSAELLNQRAFDTVPEAELEESLRVKRDTSAQEITALAAEHDQGRKGRVSRATDPVFLRENRASAMPQYDAVIQQASGPIPPSGRSHYWIAALALLLVGGSVSAFMLTRHGDKGSVVAGSESDASPAPLVADAQPFAVPAFDASALPDASQPGSPDARGRRIMADRHRPDRPDLTIPDPPTRARGNLEVSIHTKPRGAQLFIGNSYAGTDGLNIRRKIGTKIVVNCHLRGYLDGSVEVKFDRKSEIFQCKLRKKRIRKCVIGTKNPFDECPEP